MKCRLVEQNFVEFIEGKLSVDLQTDIAEHLGNCANCRSLLQNIMATYRVRDQHPQIRPPLYFYTRLEQKLKSKRSEKSLLARLVPAVWQPVAVGFMIVAGISIGVYIGSQVPLSINKTSVMNKNEILNTYVSEYYLDGSADQNLDNLISNE